MELRGFAHHVSYQSMGTTWTIGVDDISAEKWKRLQEEVRERSSQFDETYSRFIDSSFVSELAKKTGRFKVPADFVAMLRWYVKLYGLAEKKLNPLVGNTLNDLGYDARYSLEPHASIRSTPSLDETVTIIDEQHIEVREPVLFDFGALGKGYFVDRLTGFLKENECQRFLVDGSGDIFYEGRGEAIRVGLEHPADATKVIGVLPLFQGALCGSAGNRRRWQNYHHIIDPSRQTSPQDMVAVWVLADEAVLADALATCLFFVSPENFSAQFRFEYLLLNSKYEVKRSPGFHAELF